MPKRSRFSSRDRLSRLSRLRRDSSRLSGTDAPLNAQRRVLNRRPKRKRRLATWLLTPLIVLALLFIAGYFYVRQTVDVERIVRLQVVPQLEKQLNTRVEIGRIESDYISGVTLHDIVIGRDEKLPFGALAQISSAKLSLDLPSLVLHRTDALGALRSVELDAPRVVVKRDAKGQINWAKLWKSSPNVSSTQWSGILTAKNGRVWYQDATIRSQRGVPLVADAQNVSLQIIANGAAPATFSVAVPQAFVGHKPNQTTLRNLAFDGGVDAKGQWAILSAKVARVPVALLVDYADIEYSKTPLPLVGSGEIGGVFQLALDANALQTRRVLWTGNATVYNVGVLIPSGVQRLPNVLGDLQTRLKRLGENVSAQQIYGNFAFSKGAFSSDDLSLRALGSTWKVSGAIANLANAPLTFDLKARTKNADTTRLARLFPIFKTTIRGGLSSGNLRVTGDATRAKIGGDFFVPNASLQNANWGNVRTNSLRAVFQTDSALRDGNIRFSASQVEASNARGDSLKHRVLDGTLTFARTTSDTVQIALDASAPNYALRRASFGAVEGNSLRAQIGARLTKRDNRWNGQGKAVFRTANLVAQYFERDGQKSFARAANASGTLDFNGDFSYLTRADTTLHFDANGVALRNALWGNGNANTARGTIGFGGTNARGALSTDVTLSTLNAFPQPRLWRAIAPNANVAFASQVRAQTLRVLVSTSDVFSAAPRWNGVSSFSGLDASRFNVAALAPNLARRVRDLGEANGQVQFAIDGKTPMAFSGDFALSRAQIDEFKLRQIVAKVFYRNGVVQLRNARAQSDEGPLLLDANYDTKNARGTLGLNAPFVQINAGRINHFLRGQNLQFSGTARGQLRISTSLSRGAAGPLQATFDLRVPNAQLRSVATNRVRDIGREAVLDVGETRVQGRGVWRNGARGDWKFLGKVRMRAENARLQNVAVNLQNSPTTSFQLGNFALPNWSRGAQLFGLRLTAQGEIARDTNASLQPRLSGILSATRVTLNLPTNNSATRSLLAPSFELRQLQANFSATQNRLQLARWQARAPQLQETSAARRTAALLSGFLNLENGALSGQFLARDLDAARVQRLGDYFLPSSLRQSQPALRGVLFARAALGGTLQSPRAALQARLYRGALAFTPSNPNTKTISMPISIPIDAAKLDMNLAPSTANFAVQNLVLWSRGGRLAAGGTISPDIEYSNRNAVLSRAPLLNWSLQLANWRVRELTQLLPKTAKNGVLATFDGALSGDLQLTGTTSAPRISGKATLKLASLNGVDVPQIEAKIVGEQNARGPKLVLTQINGRVEDAAIAGEATFDVPRNSWAARLSATDLPAERLVRLSESLLPMHAASATSSTRNAVPWRVYPNVSAAMKARPQASSQIAPHDQYSHSASAPMASGIAAGTDGGGRIPLHGKISAVLIARGDFGANQKTTFTPLLREAKATLLSPDLTWRGRDLGALTADLSLQNGLVRIGDFSLLRRLTANEIAFNAAAQSNANEAESASVTEENLAEISANDVAQIRVGGSFPLEFNALNATPFDISISVENERFTVLRSALQELGRVLAARRIYLANLDILLRRLNSLPSDLEGRLNAKTQLAGRWGELSVSLDANVDNARTSTQSLPALQTSLVFVNGEIQINNFEIKQVFSENEDGDLLPTTGAVLSEIPASDPESGPANDGDKSRRVRETALRVASGGRIVPGGDISLDVDVLKANLAQLAGWVPELKIDGGKAALRGELSLFSFEVRGKTASPEVTGSIEARNLSYKNYTLDRFRVAQFDIKNGMLTVEPGKLTVVKGGFQSSAANGSVPWSWGENGGLPGPKRNGELKVNFPLQTKDFGALAGAFIPALTNVAADGFSGSVDVTGTLDAPRFAGQITLKNARFRADPVVGPFAFGVNSLNGSLRFADGNRVLVEGLSGQLARAEAVKATSTGNRPAIERLAVERAASGRSVVSTETNVAAVAVRQANLVAVNAERPDLGGKFTLDGDVTLDLGGGDPTRAGSRLPFHHYNLDFSLRDGAFRSALLSGLREVSLDASWKTGDGAPQLAQTVSWKMNAKGRPNLKVKSEKQTRGTLISSAMIRLAPNFTDSVNALLHSRFDGDVELQNLGWEVRNLGAGVLDGNLKLDNGTTNENANVTLRAPQKLQKSVPQTTTKPVSVNNTKSDGASTRSSASMSDLINGVVKGANDISSTRYRAEDANSQQNFHKKPTQSAPEKRNFVNIADENLASDGAPLRVSGALVVSQTEVRGLPASSGEGADFLLPAPNLDIAISTGKNVRFTTPTLRAEFDGSLAVAGTPRNPRITGVVATRNGQIRFPTASARIEEGTVEIEVARDSVSRELRTRATIEATARGQVGRYAITIGLHGPLDLGNNAAQNLRVDVTSDPPLSQDEAFAQLTGTSLRDLNTGNPLSGNAANQAYARAVVGLLSAPLFSDLERSLEQSLGLSSLTLDYRLNEPLGIEIGKAIGNRVFVTYRRSLARGTIEQPSSSVRVDFRIAGGVQLGIEGDDTGRKRVTIGQTFRF